MSRQLGHLASAHGNAHRAGRMSKPPASGVSWPDVRPSAKDVIDHPSLSGDVGAVASSLGCAVFDVECWNTGELHGFLRRYEPPFRLPSRSNGLHPWHRDRASRRPVLGARLGAAEAIRRRRSIPGDTGSAWHARREVIGSRACAMR